jgi:hypothetical protein
MKRLGRQAENSLPSSAEDKMSGIIHPLSLVSLWPNGYMVLFPRGKNFQGLKQSTHLNLVPRSRMVELYTHFTTRPHGLILFQLDTGTNLPYLT